MALTRKKKESLVAELVDQLNDATFVYLTDFSGLDVAQTNDLRGRFFQAGVDYKVCKNTLLSRALDEVGGLDDLKDYLAGPTAVATSTAPAAPARAIKSFYDEADTELPTIKVAYIDGAIYDGAQLDMLASLKSRDELLGDILGLLAAPMTTVAGAMQSAGSTLAGAVKAVGENGES